MKIVLQIIVVTTTLQFALAYSKYGRSCKDIGCLSNEVCVMAEDPCSYYSRDNCGMYPTCKAAGSTSGPTCQNYVCPPTQICQLDNGTPKCVPAKSSSTHVSQSENTQTSNNAPSYPQQNPSYPAQNPSYPAQNPSYPSQNNPSAPYPNQPSGGSLYPSITTPRPATQGGGYPSSGGGYAGSPPNSGYPGYPSQGYPSQGYPSQGYPSQGYPSQGYPAQGYPSQGYPSQGYPNQRYPSQGYPNQGYPGYSGYPAQSGYNRQSGYGSQGHGSSRPGSSAANPIVDKITDQLKTIGAGLLKNALGLKKQ